MASSCHSSLYPDCDRRVLNQLLSLWTLDAWKLFTSQILSKCPLTTSGPFCPSMIFPGEAVDFLGQWVFFLSLFLPVWLSLGVAFRASSALFSPCALHSQEALVNQPTNPQNAVINQRASSKHIWINQRETIKKHWWINKKPKAEQASCLKATQGTETKQSFVSGKRIGESRAENLEKTQLVTNSFT